MAVYKDYFSQPKWQSQSTRPIRAKEICLLWDAIRNKTPRKRVSLTAGQVGRLLMAFEQKD